jgi:hypothetical protein
MNGQSKDSKHIFVLFTRDLHSKTSYRSHLKNLITEGIGLTPKFPCAFLNKFVFFDIAREINFLNENRM